MFRTIVSRTAKRAPRATAFSGKRNMGGGAMPYKEPGGNLFNKPPTADQSWASWEYGYWTTAFAGLVFGTFGLSCRQDTSIKSWAMSEARARGDADGADVKIGESFTETHGFTAKVGEVPIYGNPDEEDDDDE